MPDMSSRCPRCGSENREQRDTNSRSEISTYTNKPKTYYVYTKTYKCNDCGLIYIQEES